MASEEPITPDLQEIATLLAKLKPPTSESDTEGRIILLAFVSMAKSLQVLADKAKWV